ncbi:hypothetical protein [Methanosarcina sp. WWM596]|uniref:hypothetical protein n=1 Tax=Methanosarcina sp. WWM596 TaxID=1434103 RepID=UPI0012E094CB|nr:hypothetical protein [Methanosarcina sp. WWM596]
MSFEDSENSGNFSQPHLFLFLESISFFKWKSIEHKKDYSHIIKKIRMQLKDAFFFLIRELRHKDASLITLGYIATEICNRNYRFSTGEYM